MPDMLIRSVFDQYSHLENRVTNALIQILANDPRLTREFIRFSTKQVLPTRARPSYSCQRTPGERRRIEDERPDAEEALAEKKGIPDAWIYFENWALLIEAKIGATLTRDQLMRHLRIARSRRFEPIHVLVVTTAENQPRWFKGLQNAHWQTWRDVYHFLSVRSARGHPVSNFLIDQFLGYIRAIEARREAGDNILSTFEGVPFGEAHPYRVDEARVVLRSLLLELRPQLASALETMRDPVQRRRTGPWEIVPFQFSRSDHFTTHPHISIEILENESSLSLVLPNAAKDEYWRRLKSLNAAELQACFLESLEKTRAIGRQVEPGLSEPRLMFQALHRHYQTPSRYIIDGSLRFDVEALTPGGAVKALPGWIDGIESILRYARKVNLQVELMMVYPAVPNSISRKPEFVEELVKAARALKPFLDLLRGNLDPS